MSVFSPIVRNWRFLLEKPVRLALVLASLGIGGVAGVPVEQRMYSYMWTNPEFCGDCHVHDYANRAYERSVHAGLTTCHDCHIVPVRHYPRNLVMALFDRPRGPEDIPHPDVATVICTRCHSAETDKEALTGPMPDAVRRRVVKIDDSPLHRAHMESKVRTPVAAMGGEAAHAATNVLPAEAPIEEHGAVRPDWDNRTITCMDCHGSKNNRAHRFEASTDNCLQCHEDIKLPGPRLGKLQCQECHFEGFVGVPGTGVEKAP